MILRRLIAHFKKQEWTAVGLDFLIVVMGVFIGIQLGNWNEARVERAAEGRFLVRLQAETRANIADLENTVGVHQRRAEILSGLEAALRYGGDAPPDDALQEVLCRYFVQPGAVLQDATYEELVASGGLSILRDEELRILLSRQQALQTEAERIDILTPAIQRAAEPLDDYREWVIPRQGERQDSWGRVICRFDVEAMRNDARIPSVIAQLYRDQRVTESFRVRVLDVTKEIDRRLGTVISARHITLAEGEMR